MIGLAIATLLIAFLVWVLFTPLIIRVNTIENSYELKLLGLLRTWLSVDQKGLAINVWVPMRTFKTHPTFSIKSATSGKRKVKAPAFPKLIKRLPNVLRSFRVKVFEASLDTDDYILNAHLFPFCQLLRSYRLNVSINFQGNTYFTLEMRNNLYRLGLAFLGFKNY